MVSQNYSNQYSLIGQIDHNNCLRIDKNGLVKIVSVDDKVYNMIFQYFVDRIKVLDIYNK